MNHKQWQQAEAQLPEGAKILRTYNAFENGELRIIVKLPGAQHETRYVARFDGEDVKLEHKP